MKMTKLVTTSAVLVSVMALGSVSAFAADGGTLPSNGTVKFTTDDSVTPPVDPINPVDPITPVDPVDPDTPIIPGTKGPLSIDFVSPLYFGEQAISAVDKTYNAVPQPTIDKDDVAGTRPNYVQVTDKRGGEQGWVLQVKQNGQFTTTVDGTDHELTGAKITFKNGQVESGSNSVVPSIFTTDFSLTPDGTGAAETVMQANAGEGAGTQIYRAGDDATKADSVTLDVPGQTIKYSDTYKTSLTWTLAALPENE